MSTCRSCGFENTEEEQFCGGCGISLAGRSFVLELSALAPALAPKNSSLHSALSNPVQPHSAIEKIEVPKAHSTVPERRQLTVMFCDLVGSSRLSEQLDPEQWREILRRYQSTCTETIKHYDGYIARFVGDGIMTYFGYPNAHENDAERAVHTALELVQAVSEIDPGYQGADPLAVRVGIATGLVVAGDLIGDGSAEQHAIVGQTPNVAARLHHLAEPGEVVVADQTRRLIGPVADFEDFGAHTLTGMEKPVGVWKATASRLTETARPERRRSDNTALVGRSGQMLSLRRAWDEARRGLGRVVIVSGEAGIGKSRLAREMSIVAESDNPTQITYQCSPYHTASPLYPFLSHLEDAAKLARENEYDLQVRDTWRRLVRDSGENVSKTIPIFNFLLDADDSDSARSIPIVRKEQTAAALTELFEGLTNTETVLAVVEDAQWIDPTSADFLSTMISHISNRRVLLVITTRGKVPSDWTQQPHVTHVELPALTNGATGQLVDVIAGSHKPDLYIREAIVDRSGGNPLFAQELARSVCVEERDAGLETLIPESLRELLSARLGEAGFERDIASVAAVIGREFSTDLLMRVAECDESTIDIALGSLIDSGVVVALPKRKRMFAFHHALIQEAAYDGLLLDRRSELHGRVADLMLAETQLGAGGWAEIAWHLTRADRHREAATFWTRAAKDAFGRASNKEMIDHAENALAALAKSPRDARTDITEMRLQVLLGAGHRALQGFASTAAERAFERGIELSKTCNDTALTLDAIRGLFTCYYARGELVLARELATRARELATSDSSASVIAVADFLEGAVEFWRGNFNEAQAHFERALEHESGEGDSAMMLSEQIDLRAAILGHLGWTQWMTGNPALAMMTCEDALKTAREIPQPFMAAMTLFWVCATNICMGNANAAGKIVEQFARLSNQNEFSYLSAVVIVLQGQTLVMKNKLKEGLETMSLGLKAMRECQGGIGQPWVLSMVASAQARAGDVLGARETATMALKRTDLHGENHWRAELLRVSGEVALTRRELERAESLFREALTTAKTQGARALELRVMMSFSRLQNVAAEQSQPPVDLPGQRGVPGADSGEADSTTRRPS